LEKPSLAHARSLHQRVCLWNTFVTIGSAHAFVELFAATVSHLLTAIWIVVSSLWAGCAGVFANLAVESPA